MPKRKKITKKEIEMPAEFVAALNKNEKALATFKNLGPSHKHEYLEWITEAKTKDTKNKRITASIELLSNGKSRHWKYAKK